MNADYGSRKVGPFMSCKVLNKIDQELIALRYVRIISRCLRPVCDANHQVRPPLRRLFL